MNLPKKLWLVRHGESLANLARHKAEAEGLPEIDFPFREPDVPLSELGRQQASETGKWLSAFSKENKPTRIYVSPFARTLESAKLVADAVGLNGITTIVDERLREREMGIFDRLTKIGALQKYPDEYARRERVGKYYYRAPGGENWCDVILRVRSFWHDLLENETAENVLIVTHEVVIRCFRCVIESLAETQIMEIDRLSDIKNGAITEYEIQEIPPGLKLLQDNFLPGV